MKQAVRECIYILQNIQCYRIFIKYTTVIKKGLTEMQLSTSCTWKISASPIAKRQGSVKVQILDHIQNRV